MNYILDDKYIVIEKNKLKSSFDYLYSIGYTFQYTSLNEQLKTFYKYEKIYITTFFDKYLVWNNIIDSTISSRKELDINRLLRESKLKRILK